MPEATHSTGVSLSILDSSQKHRPSDGVCGALSKGSKVTWVSSGDVTDNGSAQR